MESRINNDINSIVLNILNSYNKFSYKVSHYDLPELIRSLFYFIVEKYNIILTEDVDKVNSAIELVMFKPCFNQQNEYNDDLSIFKDFIKYK